MEFSVIKLANKIQTEADAYAFLEDLRWDGTPVCPRCGNTEGNYFLRPANGVSRKTRTGAASQRRVWKCKGCRKQFSVITGTIFQGTHISLRKWLFVVYEMCANNNGLAAREVEHKYDLTAKSAWFMLHRIREAMKREPLAVSLSGVVVADETFIGGSGKNRKKKDRFPGVTPAVVPERIIPGQRQKRSAGPQRGKASVLSLSHPATGEARSQVIADVTGATLQRAIDQHVELGATTLVTDEWAGYKGMGGELKDHKTVNHKNNEYVRYDDDITTNAAEGFFSQLKRSLDGTHHHVSAVHLPRYLAEFDFRYSTRTLNDSARTKMLFDQVGNRRLTTGHSPGSR